PALERVCFQRNAERYGMVTNDDYAVVALQGSSQWDALAHCGADEDGVDGVFYNGVGRDSIDETGFAHRNGIDKMAEAGIVGRGVLVDVARYVTGSPVERLPSDYLIEPELFTRCLASQRVEVEPGDIV